MASRRALRSVNMDSEKRTEAMHKQEISYHKSCHQTEIVVKDEEARRLKLRGVLLRDDIAALKDELKQKEERIKKLLSQHDAIQEQLHATAEKARQQENHMRSQAREIANLKEEMESLADINKDSAKLRTEKLALSRELDILKPELEHLRSQLTHQKTVLAEKLALERQVNALEVELANEKRAAERLQGRDKDAEEELHQKLHDLEKQLAKERRAAQNSLREGHEAHSAEAQELKKVQEELAEARKKLAAAEKQKKTDAKAAKAKTVDNSGAVTEELEQLRMELADTKRQLANEKREKERILKEAEKAAADAEGLRLPLEERIDNLKAKLRETREQLKECRADLERAQEAAATAAAKASTMTKVPTKKAAPAKAVGAKKRRANEISGTESGILQTPGKDDERPRRAFKKPFAPAAVGEKSTFSITPFLNKTVNLSDSSLQPIAEDEPQEQDENADASEPAVSTDTPSKAVTKKKQLAPSHAKPKAALTESSPNMPVPKNRKVPSAEPTLEKVAEEVEEAAAAEQENQAPTAPAVKEKKRMVLKNRAITSALTEAPATAASTKSITSASAPAVPEPKKKKRKLLGGASTSVLFDGTGDEEDAPVPAAVVAPAKTAVKRVPMGKVGLSGAGAVAKRAVNLGAGAKNAFGGSFSPLKRDRRGVSASFLA